MTSLEAVRRPFAAFFEQALGPSWVLRDLSRPRFGSRLPLVDDEDDEDDADASDEP